ncbi:protease-like protein, partial [mine drainage metagenome]
GFWDGQWYGFLGTSLGSPSWAGIYADMNQMVTQKDPSSGGLGFVAPALYQVASGSSSPFHDITTGNNGEFYAAPGWDPVTGLGTPDVAALAQDLVSLYSQGQPQIGTYISAVTPIGGQGAVEKWLVGASPIALMNTRRSSSASSGAASTPRTCPCSWRRPALDAPPPFAL